MITAKIICDSISANGIRLATLEVTLPRIILAEFNTHRVFSRNSASSRAIPVEKMIEKVRDNPFIPMMWPVNQKGMQASSYLEDIEDIESAKWAWLAARDSAIVAVAMLIGDRSVPRLEKYRNPENPNPERKLLSVHKQIANRLLEPWLWHTVIVTATEWSNFFAQRCHPDAQPEMRMTAEAMRAAMLVSEPVVLDYGQWHLPYVSLSDLNEIDCWEKAKKISIARCARVSYLTHDGVRSFEKDIELYDKLVDGMHWSPFEHVATPMPDPQKWSGNFRGWYQARKEHAGECR